MTFPVGIRDFRVCIISLRGGFDIKLMLAKCIKFLQTSFHVICEIDPRKDFCQKIRKYFFLFFLTLRHIEIYMIQIFRLVKVK